jgi:hypothetical protein
MSRAPTLLLPLLLAACDSPAMLHELQAIHARHTQVRDELAVRLSNIEADQQAWQAMQDEIARRTEADPSYSLDRLAEIAETTGDGAQVQRSEHERITVRGRGGPQAFCQAIGGMAQRAPLARLSSAVLVTEGRWEYTVELRNAVRGLRPSEVEPPLPGLPDIEGITGRKSKSLHAEVVAMQAEIEEQKRTLGSLMQLPVRTHLLSQDGEDDLRGDRSKRASWLIVGLLCDENAPLAGAQLQFNLDTATFKGTISEGRHLGDVAMGASWWVIDTIQGMPAVTGTVTWKPLEGEPEPPPASRPVAGGGWEMPPWVQGGGASTP